MAKYSYNGKDIRPVIDVYMSEFVSYFGGITWREVYMDFEKFVKAYNTAKEYLTDYFKGLINVPYPNVSLSYGHLASLGASVTFPIDGEPNMSAFAGSIDEAIDILKASKGKDFSVNPLFQHYMDMCGYFKEAFNESKFTFRGFGYQGPLTSAMLMRGQDFLYDIYDEPEKCKEYLRLMTDSIIDYAKFCRKINGESEFSNGFGICDDFASMIPPDMWDDFVVPYLNQEYEGLSNGAFRHLHAENLTPKHLKYLPKVKLNNFQPSVADALTLQNVKENLDPGITLDWLLYGYVIIFMTDSEIEEWVDTTIKAGASVARTQIGALCFKHNKQDIVFTFLKSFDKYLQS